MANISQKYAQALYDVAEEHNIEDTILNELKR